MDDLISRKAAIDVIEDYYEVDIINEIKALPSAEPQWIPVSERLPEEDGVYIVYAPYYFGGSSSAKENHKGIMFSKYKNGKWSIEHGYYKRPNCVQAWMPLPKPPKMAGEQNGN